MNIINKSILSELESHISHEKFIRNVQTFIDYLPVQILELDMLLRTGNVKSIAEKAHMLKGTCGQFGAMRLHEIFKTIETCTFENNLTDVQMMVRALPYEFQLVQEIISLSYMHPEPVPGHIRPAASAVPAE
jgi:HPt (histidine-containing phosphotransfer) domain-containing protein